MEIAQKVSGSEGIVLVACGCFSPITNLHLRLFEMARDELGRDRVIGGFFSPTHSAYPKEGLIAAEHRVAMCKLACANSDWIAVDDWESLQSDWTRTRLVMESLKTRLSACNVKARVMLLAGADLLQSFKVPGLWSTDDLQCILSDQHGLVIVDRMGIDVGLEMLEQDILYQHRHNLHWVRQPVENNVSSTLVRLLIRRSMSIRYLVPDEIIAYLQEHKLYQHKP